MMRKLSWVFLLLLVFWVSCEDPPKVQEPSAQPEVVVGSAEELRGITAKKIIWEKDGGYSGFGYHQTFLDGRN